MQLSLPRVPVAAPVIDAVCRRVWTRVRVPDDLTAVTRVDRLAEVDPRDAGMTLAGRDKIWGAVEHLFRGGVHPAITMVVRRRGKIVLKRSIGCVRGNVQGDHETPVVMQPDSPVSLFSASKSISALQIGRTHV